MSFSSFCKRFVIPLGIGLVLGWLGCLLVVGLIPFKSGIAALLHEISAYCLLGLFTLIVVWVLAFLLHIGWRLLVWVRSRLALDIHGNEVDNSVRIVSLLVALAIASTLFGADLTAFFFVILNFLSAFAIDAPVSIGAMFVRSADCISREIENMIALAPDTFDSTEFGSTPLRVCVPEMLTTATDTLRRIFIDTVDGLGQVDIRRLLLALVVFFAALYAVERVATSPHARTRFWAAYAFMTFTAIYFALSATLSVSVFEDAKANRTSLQTQNLTQAISAVQIAAPPVVLLDYQGLDPQGLDLLPWPNGEIQAEAQPIVRELKAITRSIERQAPQLGQLLAGHGDYLAQLRTMAEGAFTSQDDLVATKFQASDHFARLRDWYVREATLYTQMLSACSAQHAVRVEIVRKWKDYLTSVSNLALPQAPLVLQSDPQALAEGIASRDPDALAGTPGEDPVDEDTDTVGAEDTVGPVAKVTQPALQISVQIRQVIRESRRDFERDLIELDRRRDCDPMSRIPVPPTRGAITNGLGPVGSISSWLLDTGSTPVTLIVGLLGYGLLGALISHFVLSPNARPEVESITEFTIVALRGFIAALIVFIGSFGGLQILAENATSPDPYGIFALCLAGAAYSDQIWRRVREQLRRAVSDADNDATDRPAADEGETEPPAPKPG